MESKVQECFQDFLRERLNNIVVSLREDKEYYPYFRKLVDNSAVAEKLRNEQNTFLNAEEINSLKIYINSFCETSGIENRVVYCEGFRDCVALLKELHIL